MHEGIYLTAELRERVVHRPVARQAKDPPVRGRDVQALDELGGNEVE